MHMGILDTMVETVVLAETVVQLQVEPVDLLQELAVVVPIMVLSLVVLVVLQMLMAVMAVEPSGLGLKNTVQI
jgi:hypothetical protein